MRGKSRFVFMYCLKGEKIIINFQLLFFNDTKYATNKFICLYSLYLCNLDVK